MMIHVTNSLDEGGIGSVGNRKTAKKKKKTRQNKKIYQHRKSHAKPINFHIPVVKPLSIRYRGDK